MAEQLTQKDLKSLLSYDADTGIFRWLVCRGGNKPGDAAGGFSSDGRIVIGINRRLYLAHRLAWLYANGSWPENEIDHINNDPTDNRLANLRCATRAKNQCNVRLLSRNKSGVKGVSWDSISGKWVARICHDGKYLNIGRFYSICSAEQAIKAARERLHGEFANHG